MIKVDTRTNDLAAEVIGRATKTEPADRVLRGIISQRKLAGPEARDLAEAVFTYFRWFGCADPKAPMAQQLELTRRAQARFLRLGQQFPDAELMAKAVPEWLSSQMEVTLPWVRSLQSQPKLWLRARPGTGAQLSSSLGEAELSQILPDAVAYNGPEDLFRSAEFHKGAFEIQDISSQAVTWMCVPKPGETWWDACAGEGGKTMHLSDLLQNKGMIWASDRAEWRLTNLKRRAKRAGVFNYRAVVWPTVTKLPTKTKFDGILVDAPCSGVGTWGRNPHARWSTTTEDIRELSILQRSILDAVAGSLKPGGRLVYSVCTLTRAETTEVARSFSAAHSELKPMSLENPWTKEKRSEHFLWPQETGGNGMFIAAWQASG